MKVYHGNWESLPPLKKKTTLEISEIIAEYANMIEYEYENYIV